MKLEADIRNLDDAKGILGLSDTELADLFEITERQLARWRSHGIPKQRRESVIQLSALARYLIKRLSADNICRVVHTPDAWLENRTLLDVIRADGFAEVYAYCDRLFSYTDDRPR